MESERTAVGEAAFANHEIVGREEELRRIGEFVESHGGGPAALVVQGEAGIGKTTLWHAGVHALEASGYRVLRTSPSASEATLSLSALADLLEPAYADVRADLPPPQRRSLDVALALAEPGDPESFRDRTLHAATRSALVRLGQLGPVALAVDDLQWVDAESAAALSYALRRLGPEPVLLLFSLRTGTTMRFDLDEIGSVPLERITVGPLSLGATQRLLATVLGVAYPRQMIRRLVDTSGGNPFYALELALALERGGTRGSDDPPALSEKLDALIAARLDALSPHGQDLVGTLSLLPSATLPQLDAVHLLGGLDEVVAAGIARVDGVTVGWAHPLLAAGAHARIGPEERRSRHAMLAETLEDPVERARHLARAHITSSSWAAGELAAAAELAASRGLSAVAAELADDAVRLTPDAETREGLERLFLAASAHARAGSFDKARALADELIPQLEEGDVRADALRLRARVTGDIATQRDFIRRALQDTNDPSICAEANALLVRNYLYTGELDEALAAARAAMSQAAATTDRRRIAAATTTLGLMEIWGTGEPSADVYRAACEFAESGEELPAETYSNPHTLIGARALYRFELGRARASYGVGAAAAEAAGETDSLETFWWGMAQLEVRAGRYAVAHEYVGLMLEAGEAVDRRPLSVRWIEGLLAVYDGHVAEARAALGDVMVAAKDGGNWFFDAYGRSALAFLELTVGDPAAAYAALEPVLSMPFVVEGDPGQTGILPLAAESAIAIGAGDRADELVSRLERRGRELDHAWCLAMAARYRGLLLAEAHEFDRALRALDEALELHEHVPAPFERARTMLALGLVRRRAKQRRAAREALDEAASVFEELATPLWLEKARAELASIGGRAPSGGELTPNELRIATLVREGKTNKEVAAALFVADRTVESALTHIYRKLGVRSRTELARKLEQA